jgi:hypothetical protein
MEQETYGLQKSTALHGAIKYNSADIRNNINNNNNNNNNNKCRHIYLRTNLIDQGPATKLLRLHKIIIIIIIIIIIHYLFIYVQT